MTWQLHHGAGAPGTIPGQTDGDNYINTDTGGMYQLVGTTWILRAIFPGLYTTPPGDAAKFWRGDASWAVPPGGSGGDVTGPASATDDNFASFNGATGKIIKDSGHKPADFAVSAKGVTNGDSHDHVGGDGAAITEDALSLSDVTTGNVTKDKHGFAPKAPDDTTKYLRGDGTWVVPVTYSADTNGYIKFPGGVTMQWGTGSSTSDTSESFTFPTSFSSACYGVQITRIGAGLSTILAVNSISTSGFTIDRDNSIDGTQRFYWFAIGV